MTISPGIHPDIHILFIDPDVSFCESAHNVLERRGFAVTVAHDGTMGLSLYSPKFQVVVAAMSVAPRGGLELLREIKARNIETQVVLLGEAGSIELAGNGLRDGAFAYLLKPFDDFLDLSFTVERAVELQQLRWQAEHPRFDLTGDAILANALRQMVESTRHADPLPKTMQFLLKTTTDIFSATHAVALRSTAGVWRMVAGKGSHDPETIARSFVESGGEDFAWRVVSERKTCSGFGPKELTGHETIQFIGTPFIVGGKILGAVVAYALTADVSSTERMQWFEAFAAQGAVAMELSRLYEESERLSPVDSLTGLFKRKNFLNLADREFRRCWRYDEPLSAIILDVDAMEEINSKHGFEFGNIVLQQVAETCRRSIRSVDLICRNEKDSFALLFPMTNEEGAKKTAERLRMIVQSLTLSDWQGIVPVSASLGVSSYPHQNCTSIQDLIGLAQGALQNARRNGANQIAFD